MRWNRVLKGKRNLIILNFFIQIGVFYIVFIVCVFNKNHKCLGNVIFTSNSTNWRFVSLFVGLYSDNK